MSYLDRVRDVLRDVAMILAALVPFAYFAVACHSDAPIHATWDGTRFSCPAKTDVWASEPEALAGREDYVYCIPTR